MVQVQLAHRKYFAWDRVSGSNILLLCPDLQPVHVLQERDERADCTPVSTLRYLRLRLHATLLLLAWTWHGDLLEHVSEHGRSMGYSSRSATCVGHKLNPGHSSLALQELQAVS